MPCDISGCSATDASFIMQCIDFCGRSFHSACAGTQRNHEQTISNFMIPLCVDCRKGQGVNEDGIATRAVLMRQQSLTVDLHNLIDANYKALAALKQMDIKIETIQGACEGISTSLSDMQKEVNKLDKKIDETATVVSNKVCTEVSAIIDDAAPLDNTGTMVKIDSLTSATHKICEGQCVIDENLKIINQELIFLTERDHGPTVTEILEKIKAISANLPVGEEQTLDLHKTLAEE